MKATDDRAELLDGVIEMLLADRQAALTSGNIATALTAAVKVADLLALKLQPQGPGGDIAVQPDEVDPRQLGRAILQVLGSGVMDDAEPDEDAMPRATHELTAQHIEPVDDVDALDLSDAPEPAASHPEPELGERDLVGDAGHFVQAIEIRGGRGRWAICDPSGANCGAMWGTRQEATAACLGFIKTGMIVRAPKEAVARIAPEQRLADRISTSKERINGQGN
jgi:hypothetical protein